MDVARNCIYGSAMQNRFAETSWIDSDIGTSTLPRAMSNDCGVVNCPPPCVSAPRKLDENSPASFFSAPVESRSEAASDRWNLLRRLHRSDRLKAIRRVGPTRRSELQFATLVVMTDALHPSTKGYEIWAEAVKEPLSKLMTTEKPSAE